MRGTAVLVSLALALQPARAAAQALNEAADMAGSAGTGDRRFDGSLSRRDAAAIDAKSDGRSPSSTLAPPAASKKEVKPAPPAPEGGKLDLDSPQARRGQVKGALIGGAVGAVTGAILGWGIFGGIFGIIALAVVGAVLAGAIGQDAGRHCGADPECG